MGFLSVAPAASLLPFVTAIWDCDMPMPEYRLERILPKPGAALIINRLEDETRSWHGDDLSICRRQSGSVLVGPGTCSSVIDTREQVAVVGVEFHPAGAGAFFADALDGFRDRDIDLADLARDAQSALRERVLEARAPRQRLQVVENWLLSRLRVRSAHAVVAWATAQLDQAPAVVRIADIIERSGYSARRFQDLFLRNVGIGPKRYARLQRFRGAVMQAHAGRAIDWSSVATAGGYHDQAHLVHEFRTFSGMTPGAYQALRGPWPDHVALPAAKPVDECRILQDARSDAG